MKKHIYLLLTLISFSALSLSAQLIKISTEDLQKISKSLKLLPECELSYKGKPSVSTFKKLISSKKPILLVAHLTEELSCNPDFLRLPSPVFPDCYFAFQTNEDIERLYEIESSIRCVCIDIFWYYLEKANEYSLSV